jgi:hypothetical protein
MSRFRSCYVDRADDALTVEILDVLLRFATRTRPGVAEGAPPRAAELRRRGGSASSPRACQAPE